jgi:hypothetical protein
MTSDKPQLTSQNVKLMSLKKSLQISLLNAAVKSKSIMTVNYNNSLKNNKMHALTDMFVTW